MTVTQSQIRDALDYLDDMTGKRVLDIPGGRSPVMFLSKFKDVIRTILQSALDTLKPAGDVGEALLTISGAIRDTITAADLCERRNVKFSKRLAQEYPERIAALETIRAALNGDCGGGVLDKIISEWPEDAEWKPVQTLCQLADQMEFPAVAVLNGGKVENGKDYILRDVVEKALTAPVVDGWQPIETLRKETK